MSEKRNPFMEKFLSRVNKLAGASPQATRTERICGNCGLPLVQGETEEMCRELDKVAARLEARRAVQPAAGTTPCCEHPKEDHFSAEMGSFCRKCPLEGNVWEHVFGEATTPQAERCIDCRHEFGVWFAENAVWNTIIPSRVGMLCPCCFMDRAERSGFSNTGWKMVPMDNPLGEKSVEPQVHITAAPAPAQTRLTAEQFWKGEYVHGHSKLTFGDEFEYWLKFAEAFRDKSESLRNSPQTWEYDCLDTGAPFITIDGQRYWAHDAKEIVALHNQSEAARSPFAAHNWQHWNEMCKIAQEQAKAALEQNAGLREEIEQLKRELSGCDDMTMEEAIEMVDVKTAPPTPSEFYSTLAHCASYPSCDGNLEGMKHSEKCPLFGRKELSLFEFAAAYTDSLYAFAENALNHGADCKVQLTELRAKLAAIIKEHETEIARYRNNFDLMIRRQDGEVWCWADDGEDHPETLACPVLIQPDVVRRFVAAEAEVAALRERERWIPVEEKLPEESKCLYSFKADILMKRGDDWRSGTFQRGQFVDVKGWVQTQITHWKALSAAPERS